MAESIDPGAQESGGECCEQPHLTQAGAALDQDVERGGVDLQVVLAEIEDLERLQLADKRREGAEAAAQEVEEDVERAAAATPRRRRRRGSTSLRTRPLRRRRRRRRSEEKKMRESQLFFAPAVSPPTRLVVERSFLFSFSLFRRSLRVFCFFTSVC